MLNFFTRYFFPKEIVIKKGSLQRLKFLDFSNPIIIHSTSSEKNGNVEKIKNFFPKNTLLKLDSGEPKLSSIKSYQDISKNDAIIAVGGGSVIDSAKLLIAKLLSKDSISSLKPFMLKEDNQNKHHIQHAGDVDDVAIIGRRSLAAIHTVASVMLV